MAKKIRVVASLTTMPDRYFKTVKTLHTLNKQTYKFDAIYLSLPEKSKRLGIEYPPITEEMSQLCTVVHCEDYGPITKIVGGLLSEDDPETVIISFDDDMIYPNTLVETLMQHHKKYPNSALGSSGMLLKYSCPMCAITPNEDNFLFRIPKFPVPPEGRRVDSIYGYPGALYVRKFFPIKEQLETKFLNYALEERNMFINDDITISGYLSLKGVERRIFPNMPIVSFVLDEETGTRLRNKNEISYDLDTFFQRMNAAITSSKKIGMYSQTEDVNFTETIAGVTAIVVLCVLAVILICIYLFKNNLLTNWSSYLL